jgi:heme-degrading monooxygenase HmoA
MAGKFKPPYYAVIFTTKASAENEGYEDMAARMFELAQQQDGFIAFESARQEIGITVSYWRDLESIKKWRNQVEHREAQRLGRELWYDSFELHIARVESYRSYHR